MAFIALTSDQYLNYVRNNTYFRNPAREDEWGEPVYFVPHDRGFDLNGFGGPHYEYGYNYTNSPETVYGNCTWWVCGRLREAMGKNIMAYMNWRSPSADDWYDAYTGTKHTSASSAHAGDIICFSGGTDGHVMFIEKIENGTVYISHSAWSYRTYWSGYACRVNTYPVSSIYAGASIDMYKGTGNPYYVTVQGILHTGTDSPTPPDPGYTIEPEITVYPSSYDSIMLSNEEYLDFAFNIIVTGIPAGYSASGNNTYPGLSRVANTGWSYTDYTGSDGNTYRRATKSQTLRYEREFNSNYTTTKYMYFSFSYPNGSASSTTPMRIRVDAKPTPSKIMFWKRRKKKFTLDLI